MAERLAKLVDIGFYCLFAVAVFRHWKNDPRHVIAMPISLAAFLLWLLARHQLGKSFTVRAEAHALVTHGLYSKIRNPIYFFAFIAFAGVLIAGGWYMGLAIFLVVYYLFQTPRMRAEARVLEAAFGDEYRAYKTQTWF